MVTYPDAKFLPVTDALLTCLCQEAALNPKPPAACCYRPYLNGAPLLGTNKDECCPGLAFVYSGGPAYPSRSGFPNPDGVPVSCGITWALQIQFGIWRCAPTGTLQAPPTCDQWNTLNTDLMNDFATLRSALCCFINTRPSKTVFVDNWEIIDNGPEGGCVGSSMTIRVQVA